MTVLLLNIVCLGVKEILTRVTVASPRTCNAVIGYELSQRLLRDEGNHRGVGRPVDGGHEGNLFELRNTVPEAVP